MGRWNGGRAWVFLAVIGLGLIATPLIHADHAGPLVKPDEAAEPYAPMPKLSGRLTIAGSETMQPLLGQLAAEFTKLYPEVKIAIEGQGSEAGIREFIGGYSGQRRGEKARSGHEGAAQIGMLASSRELTAEEIRAFTARHGYPPLVMPLALDAVAVYVHRDNPLEGLTLQQLDAIFSKTRNRGARQAITTWGQLGMGDGWQSLRIRAHGRNEQSGTRAFFEQVALLSGKLHDGVAPHPGPANEILAISRDPQAIGYAGIGFSGSFVRAVPLAEAPDRPYVEPSLEAVSSSRYPLTRPLLLYVNQRRDGKWRAVLLEFLKYANSREGQVVVAKAKFFPLPGPMLVSNRTVLQGETVTAAGPGAVN